MTRPHGRARVDRRNPEAFGICDGCGFLYNLKVLKNQREWYGARIQDTNMKHCPRCMDRLQEQLRVIVLPADPTPVGNPRPERSNITDNSLATLNFTENPRDTQPSIGTMSQAAGLNAAFDGNPTKPFFLSAVTYVSVVGDNTIGRNWNGLTTNNVGITAAKFIATAPTDGRLFGGGSAAWRFEGSNNGVTFTSIASGNTGGGVHEVLTVNVNPATNYLYHRFVLAGDGSHSVSVSQLQIFDVSSLQ